MTWLSDAMESIRRAAEARGSDNMPWDPTSADTAQPAPFGLSPAMSYPAATGGQPSSMATYPDMGGVGAAQGTPDTDPYAELDKQQKAEAARQAAMNAFQAGGADPMPFAGVSGQMIDGPQGQGAPFSLAPPQPNVPPSLTLAQAVTAPPPGGTPQMPPQAPTAGLNAPIGGTKAPAVASDDDEETVPAKATPTAGKLPTAPAVNTPPAPPTPVAPPQAPVSGWDRLGEGLNKNGPLLMAMGAGLAGAPSFGAGLSRAFANAGPVGIAQRQQDQALALQNQSNNITATALAKKGATPEEIAAGKANPLVMKSLIDQYLGKSKYKVQVVGTHEDEFGNKKTDYAAVNENDPTDFKPIVNGRMTDISSSNRKPIDSDAAAEAAASEDGIPTEKSVGGYLAPGVGSVDHSLSGDEYLNQYSPEVKAAVRDYIAGKSMPTANPRKGWTQNIKAIAQKYGSDTGMPVDDATFGARRTMRNDLAKSSFTSLGGQITTGEHASDILARMGKAAENLGNWDMGLAGPSHVINDIRGTTSAQASKMQGLQTEAQHYGQEITKFYSGSPGGEAERNRFMSSINAAKTPQELASVIEHESELLHDRMGSMEQHISSTLGDDFLSKNPVITPGARKSFDAVDQSVARLRGTAPVAAAPTGPLKPGKYAWTPDKGLIPQ